MSCDNVQEWISSLLDRRISAGEQKSVLAHLGSCRKCSGYFESAEGLRNELRRLPQPALPAGLVEKLRVLASHERERRLARASFSARLRHWSARMELEFDNLMRPVAVPIAGGVLSALLLFSVLVPNLSFRHNFTDESFFIDPIGSVVEQVGGGVVKPNGDVPRLEPVGSDISADANVVVLTVDENGRVSDYYLTQGKLTPDLQNIIMFSQFQPATNLGIPISGKVKVVQRPSSRNLRS